MDKEKEFFIVGYDKDNDVYETLWETDNLNAAMIQCDIFYWQNQRRELRRRDNKEPFDWFEVQWTLDGIMLYCR